MFNSGSKVTNFDSEFLNNIMKKDINFEETDSKEIQSITHKLKIHEDIIRKRRQDLEKRLISQELKILNEKLNNLQKTVHHNNRKHR